MRPPRREEEIQAELDAADTNVERIRRQLAEFERRIDGEVIYGLGTWGGNEMTWYRPRLRPGEREEFETEKRVFVLQDPSMLMHIKNELNVDEPDSEAEGRVARVWRSAQYYVSIYDVMTWSLLDTVYLSTSSTDDQLVCLSVPCVCL